MPDVPTYCELSHGIAVSLAASHEVSVITASPSYQNLFEGDQPPKSEAIDGVSVTRLDVVKSFPPMIAFTMAAARELRKRRDEIDLVIVVSEPPVLLPFAVTAVASGGYKVIQLLQDIHPEAGRAGGMLNNRALVRLLLQLDRWTSKQADCTVVLSDDMAKTYEETRPVRNLQVINNYRLDSPSEEPPSGMISKDRFNVTFAGNVGKFQNVDVLLDAAAILKQDPQMESVIVHIVGAGTELDRVSKRVNEEQLTNVVVQGRLSRAQAQGFMELSDVGVITLEPKVHRYSYPSKTMAYLDAGCELLAVVEPESSLANDMEQLSIGSIAAPDASSVAQAVRSSFERRREGKNTSAFEREATLATWRELVERVV